MLALAATALVALAAPAKAAPDAPPVYDFSEVHESLWLTVVVDLSGSMTGARADTSIAQAKASLATLDDSASVMVIVYSSSAHVWQDSWTQATRAGVEAASMWLDSMRLSIAMNGTTNHEAAFEAALTRPPPITDSWALLLVSDCEPSCASPASLLASLVRRCEEAGDVPVLVLAVEPPLGSHSNWGRSLAESTGGDFRQLGGG